MDKHESWGDTPWKRPLFHEQGAHVLVDGQFGSTGKGLLGAWLAANAAADDVTFDVNITSGGPNSGHTFYSNGEKHVLKQLPSFAVASALMGRFVPVVIGAGAIIDLKVLEKEAEKYPGIPIHVHPNAAVITPQDIEAEHSGTIQAVAGTRSGTGAALARKVHRDPKAVWGWWKDNTVMPPNVLNFAPRGPWTRAFVEVSQGFSLGINSEQFYPKVTSRECSVAQGLADARIPPRMLTRVYMAIRTFPIRVGNVDGHSSGDWYTDQSELSWEEIGVPPERTTVTNRIRRVATFSYTQLREAVRTNTPDFLFVNFLNYLPEGERNKFLNDVASSARKEFPHVALIGGYGPENKDVQLLDN